MQIPKDTVTNYPGNKKHAVTTCSHSLSCISVINLLFCDLLVSPRARESKTVLDSVFHAVDSGFQLLDPSLSQWNLESGFQSLVGFRIPWAVFRIPKPRIPDSTSRNFPGSRIRIPLRFLFEIRSITEISSVESLFTCSRLTFINQISPHVRYKFGFRDPGIFSFGFRNPESFCFLDPKPWTLESAVHVKESVIPLTIGIRNPITRIRNKQRGIQNPVLNYFTWSVWE